MSNVIFDFDGTIANSFVIVISIFHDLTHRNELLSAREIERLRGMSLMGVAKELRVQPWKMPFLLVRGRAKMSREMKRVQAFEGMPELIHELQAAGHRLYITSSNSVRNIQEFLERYKMNTEFIKIYGSVGLFNKARVLRRVVRHNHLDPHQTYYVGDEVRDIEAANHAGINIISVTWGYNNQNILAAHAPTLLLTKPAEILTSLEASNEKV